MSSRKAHEEDSRCGHCGQENEPLAIFCEGCGMELRLVARPVRAAEGHGARQVLLSRFLPSQDLDRLWSTFEAVQGCACFRQRILWPDEEDDGGSLRQELPEGTVLLSEARPVSEAGEPLRGCLDLVYRVAMAIDEIQHSGCRLNSLAFNSVIVAQETHEFVGLCLPVSLTFLDTPRAEMTLAGIDCCFAAPEVQGYVDHAVGPTVDVYALAVVTYYLLSGTAPRDLTECSFCPVTDQPDLGPSLRECLEDALAIIPERRPQSAGQFVKRVRKALVQDICRPGPVVRTACLTDIGIGGRDNNEDACGVWMRSMADGRGRCLVGVAAVADGMGGGAFGERASSLCIDRILDDSARDLNILGQYLCSPSDWCIACRDWLLRLNQEVLDLGRQLTAPNNVGSTLTAVLFTGHRAFLLHAGDSRLYLLRSGSVFRLTRNQTYAEQLHEEGQLTREEVDGSIYRNVLTSYIGSTKCVPQVEELHLVTGDTLVLCSDGLMEGLTEGEMLDLATRFGPSEAVIEMVRYGKRRLQTAPSDPTGTAGIACSDNMTAVVVQIPEKLAAEQIFESSQAESVVSEESASVPIGASNVPAAEGEANA